jgi:hypothetical protein
MIKGRTLYFDEHAHKYTDDIDTPYTSVTTVISKYVEEFDAYQIASACEKIGKNPDHPKYELYAGKTAEQLLVQWKHTNKRALDKGNYKHNYMEATIKGNSNFKNRKGSNMLYTLDDIQMNHDYGRLNIEEVFDRIGIKYPGIYAILLHLHTNGFRFYAELGVYDSNYEVSGLIDLFVVNDNNEFYIIDWKTNRAPIRYESGYWSKTKDDKLKDYVFTDNTLKHPMNHLPLSIGVEYALQTSIYALLAESFGYSTLGIIICHIRTDDNDEEIEHVDLLPIEYHLKYRLEAIKMLEDHKKNIPVRDLRLNFKS